MRKFDVPVHRFLNKFPVFHFVRLRNDVPYELLDAGVNVFLAVARHGRIFAALLCRQGGR